METLEEKIGYSFADKQLLVTALTHSSFLNESRPGTQCYERLEFLGDSVLGFVTAEFLYRFSPAIPEGQMTKIRAELVCEAGLYKVAQKLELGKYMRLGKGEERTGGRERVSVLADMVEALIAAVYLDAGLEKASEFIYTFALNDAAPEKIRRTSDNKTALQELLQKDGECSIKYEEIGESGPDHCKVFTFRVVINGVPSGEGTGRTKKEAEQAAAGRALEALNA